MDQQGQSRGPPTREQVLGWGVIAVALLLISLFGGYFLEWQWTGFAQAQVREDVQPSKTLWDWLDLLIIPFVLAIGGYLFALSENQRTQQIAERHRVLDREIAQQQAETDRDIAEQRRQDDTLQAYLDQFGQLMLDKEPSLLESREKDEIRVLARAWTLTVLARLGPGRRKRSVLQFLFESGLIDKGQAAVGLVCLGQTCTGQN